MLRFALAAVFSVALAGQALAAAADSEHNVCLVTFSSAGHAKTRDILFAAAASVMPRVSAEKLVNDYSVIFTYPDLQSTVRACQCLSNPAPANSMVQRQASLAACPKPN